MWLNLEEVDDALLDLGAQSHFLALCRTPIGEGLQQVGLHVGMAAERLMLSSTVMPRNRAMFWKVRAKPSAARSGGMHARHVAAVKADGALPAGGRSRKCS